MNCFIGFIIVLVGALLYARGRRRAGSVIGGLAFLWMMFTLMLWATGNG